MPPTQEQYSDVEKHQSVGEPATLRPQPSALTNCATLPQGTRVYLQLAASRSQKHQEKSSDAAAFELLAECESGADGLTAGVVRRFAGGEDWRFQLPDCRTVVGD